MNYIWILKKYLYILKLLCKREKVRYERGNNKIKTNYFNAINFMKEDMNENI